MPTESLIFLFLFLGFIVSFYIYYKKTKKEKLVCYIGKDCNRVLESRYSKVFSVPNEVIGMLYYALISIITLILILYIPVGILIQGRLMIVGLAALYSIYLTSIQLFVLKELCEYCLAVNIINIAIFILLLL